MDMKLVREVSREEFIQMAKRCREEIRTLRRQVTELEPRADAYDKLSAVLDLLPRQQRGHGEDLVWRIDQRLKELEEAA